MGIYRKCGVCLRALPTKRLPDSVFRNHCGACAVHRACCDDHTRCRCGLLVMQNDAPPNQCLAEHCTVLLEDGPGFCEKCTEAACDRFVRRLTITGSFQCEADAVSAVRGDLHCEANGAALDTLAIQILATCKDRWEVIAENGTYSYFTHYLEQKLGHEAVSIDQFWETAGAPLTQRKGKPLFVAHVHASPRIEVLPNRFIRASSRHGIYSKETLERFLLNRGASHSPFVTIRILHKNLRILLIDYPIFNQPLLILFIFIFCQKFVRIIPIFYAGTTTTLDVDIVQEYTDACVDLQSLVEEKKVVYVTDTRVIHLQSVYRRKASKSFKKAWHVYRTKGRRSSERDCHRLPAAMRRRNGNRYREPASRSRRKKQRRVPRRSPACTDCHSG